MKIKHDESRDVSCPLTHFNMGCKGRECPCWRNLDEEFGYCGFGGRIHECCNDCVGAAKG